MAGQPHNFKAEMRRATTPHNPPGRSQLVRGRRPEDTVTGSANMMKATATDKNESDASNEDEASSSSRDDEAI